MSELIPYQDVEKMGTAIAKSGLFGIKTQEQAIALMLVAQAEGLHPAIAARDYNIIQGRPALKSDAMLARFQQAGGSVKWVAMTDTRVSAVFSHPQGGSIEIDWDMERAKKAELGGKDMWRKYPRQMLRARVISEGIRTVFPGCVAGFYSPEEVQDFDDPAPASKVAPKNVTPKKEDASSPEPCPVDPDSVGPSLADVKQACNDAVKRLGEVEPVTALMQTVCGSDKVKAIKDVPVDKYADVIAAVNELQKEAA